MGEEAEYNARKVPPVDDEWKPRRHGAKARGAFGLVVTHTYTYSPQPWSKPFTRIYTYRHWYATERARTDAEVSYNKDRHPYRGATQVVRIER
jgi:hypothetical protein